HDFSNQLGVCVTQIAYVQLCVLFVVLIAIVSTLGFGTRSHIAIAVAGVLGVGVMIPRSLMGYSADGSGRTHALSRLGLRIFGAPIWLGGLLVIALLGGRLAESKNLRSVVERYSTIALVAFGLVVFSGIVNAALRVHDLDDLMTAYGEV